MILYVNGDSHTAGAEVVNAHSFSHDDPQLWHLGRLPHPENLAHSWGKLLSLALNAGFQCDAESAASKVGGAWLLCFEGPRPVPVSISHSICGRSADQQ